MFKYKTFKDGRCTYKNTGRATLKEGIFVFELKRRDRAQVQTDIIEYFALPFPFPSKLKIWSFHVVVVKGRHRNVRTKTCDTRAELLFCFSDVSVAVAIVS